MHGRLDSLWAIGVNEPRLLADLTWEDVKDSGISKFELKQLVKIGSASSSRATAETDHHQSVTDVL